MGAGSEGDVSRVGLGNNPAIGAGNEQRIWFVLRCQPLEKRDTAEIFSLPEFFEFFD